MAKLATAKSRAGKAGTHGQRSGSGRWLQGLLCGGVVTLATPTAILATLLLTPALVAAAFDEVPGRPAARPVILWGVAASLQPMIALWTGGHSVAHALGLACDLPTLATAWVAQAGAWLLTELLPIVVGLAYAAAAAAQSSRLHAARARHEDEWSIPPRAEIGGQPREA